jgi:hypothetical protein
MAVIALGSTTPQVRPWPAGGAWNNIALSATNVPLKSTNWGVTLKPGFITPALGCCGQFINGGQAGTADRLAQKRAHAIGLELRDTAEIATAQTTAGATANVLDRGEQSGVATITIVTTIGATPTCTYQVEGSPDNSAWSPLSTADSATPTTFTTATFVITTATTVVRIVNPASGSARYIRVTLSAVTNVTSTINAAVG